MHLDDYRIAIRERSYLDLLDLGLRVCRVHARPLFLLFLMGAVPAALINAALLQLLTPWTLEMSTYGGLYVLTMTLLVAWEAPLVTAPMTVYLGQALFAGKPQLRGVFKDFLKSLPQLVLLQMILRGILLFPLITSFVPLFLWPYLGEVILLERNPLTRGRSGRMTTMRRNKALHAGSGGDLFGRWAAAMCFGGLLIGSLYYSLVVVGGMLIAADSYHFLLCAVYYPLALWPVVGYFVVVRFLSYLDLRIRREGWEVELLLRAENARLSRQPA